MILKEKNSSNGKNFQCILNRYFKDSVNETGHLIEERLIEKIKIDLKNIKKDDLVDKVPEIFGKCNAVCKYQKKILGGRKTIILFIHS